MGFKYHNRRDNTQRDGLYFKSELFVHSSDRATHAPQKGMLATWTESDAVVVDFEEKPMGPHFGYEITARELDSAELGVYYNLVRIPQPRGFLEAGQKFTTEYFCLAANASTLAPVEGKLAYIGNDSSKGYWTPTPSVVVALEGNRIGNYMHYTITAREIDSATNGIYYGLENSITPEGLVFRTGYWMLKSSESTLAPQAGTISYLGNDSSAGWWTPVESIISDFTADRVGDYVHYVIEAKESYLKSSDGKALYASRRSVPQNDGLRYETDMWVPYSSVSSLEPKIGTLAYIAGETSAYWTPTAALVIDYSSVRTGGYVKYHIIAREIDSAASGIYYRLERIADGEAVKWRTGLFISTAQLATLAPTGGTLAAWAPLDAVVIAHSASRTGGYWNFTIEAREIDSSSSDGIYFNLRREEHRDGTYYRTGYFISEAQLATLAPHVGDLISSGWAPTTSYVWDFTAHHIGSYWNFEILARDVDLLTIKKTDRGWEYWKTFFVSSDGFDAFIPDMGEVVDWTPRTCYALDHDSDKIGTNYLVKIHAVESSYFSGISGAGV